MDQEISALINQAVADQIFPGAVVGYLMDSKTQLLAYGRHTYEQDSPSVSEDTLYDVASIAKSIPTSSLILWLIDQGKLSLDSPVSNFIPELGGEYKDQIKIWHLLTYTVVFDFDGQGLSEYAKQGTDELLRAIYKGKLTAPPGEAYFYTNAPALLLGLTAERVLKKPLDIAANEIFFNPLKMKRTTFTPSASLASHIAPTETDDWRGHVQAEPHDESAWALRQTGIIAGNAGLFSTAEDLLTFADMLVNGGTYGGHTYLTKPIIEQMHKNQIASLGQSTGLGWELNQNVYMGKYSSGLFGKTGFTGCVILIQPRLKRALVLLSNYTYPKRKSNRDQMDKLRSQLADIVFRP